MDGGPGRWHMSDRPVVGSLISITPLYSTMGEGRRSGGSGVEQWEGLKLVRSAACEGLNRTNMML